VIFIQNYHHLPELSTVIHHSARCSIMVE